MSGFNFFTARTLEELHYDVVDSLAYSPRFTSSPRGQRVHEALGVTLELRDPRCRIIASPLRKADYGFAVGELCWYLRGDDDLATMKYYNKRMDRFSDDGKTLRSSYGARIFNGRFQTPYVNGAISQTDMVMEELIRDPDSRRAVLHINEPDDLLTATTAGTKDVPCTLSLQLFIRDRRLHMHTTMRSNDVWWGLPYDVFSFTCIQEVMLLKLQEQGVPVDDLGNYYHTVGSIHLYEQHVEKGRDLRKEFLACTVQYQEVEPMAPLSLGGLQTLLYSIEPDIREGVHDAVLNGERPFFGPGEEPFDWMAERLIAHRVKRLKEGAGKDDRTWG